MAPVHAGPDLVSGGSGCSCMLLVHPTPTCTDAIPSKTCTGNLHSGHTM